MTFTRPTILHIMNNYEDSSILRIVLRLVEHLGSEEFDWRIGSVNAGGDMQKEFQRLNAQVVDFSADSSSPHRKIRAYLQQNPVQLVHTHTPRTIIAASRALWGLPKIPHVATKHLLTSPHDRSMGFLFTIIDRLELFLPAYLVPVSQAMAKQILSQPGIRPDHVFPISNAIPCDEFYQPDQRIPFRQEIGLSEDTCVIGYAGRIEKVKRIDLLLEAFSLLSKRQANVHLLLAGDGDMKPALLQAAKEMGIQKSVTWLGFYRNMPRFLAAVDIYAQSSLNEGLSLSILEAMAAGKPVVATRVGGEDEVISDGQTGLLVQPGSAQSAADALTRLVEDAPLRIRLGSQGKTFVFQHFNIERLVRQYRDLYNRLAVDRMRG
jgi:glycosyltransferase involved in cell wall biosynthesis